MYKFYANGELISPLYADSDTYLVSNPELELGLNRINTLTFQIHRNHPKLSSLAQRSTYIRVIDESEEIFYGRIIEADSDFYGTGEIVCESELAFLRDSMMRPFVYRGSVSGFLSMLLDNHNLQVDAARKLELGTIAVIDNNDYILRSTSEAVDTWSLLTAKLVKIMGGYLRVRADDGIRYLDYLADYGELEGQSVQFGQNLLDLVLSKNSGDIVTCLIPYGAEFEEEADGYEEEPENGSWAGNRLTIASVNGGKDYIENGTGIQLYGRIWGTEIWDDVTEPENLLKKAQQWLESQAVCPESITASVVDLHLADRDIPRFRVGYWVEAFSRPHDLKIKLGISSIKMHLDDPTKDKITLGVEGDSLTGRTAGTTATTRITLATIQQLQEASFSKIEATQIKTETMAADLIAANNLIAKKATIEQLNAVEAYITNLDAEKASIKELEAAVASIHELIADYATIDHLEANYATIDRLEAVVGSFETLLADYATIEHLEANYATIDKLNTDLANIKKLFADYARIDSLDAKYANIDFANIGMAAVEKLFSESGIIKDLVVGDTSITGELVGVTIKGDLIEGNTVKADKLVVKGSDGLYYKLNVSGETVEAQQTDENSLNGSIITAKSITATKISVKDLVAFNATIGGYHITDKSLYSGAKASADNTTRGVYMDSDGQFSVGDAFNYLRFFKGSDGKYKLELSASSMVMSTGQTVEDAIGNVQSTIDKTRVVMLTSAAYTFNGTTAGAPVGSTCSTQVLAYNGATPCKVTVGTVTCPTGISATVTNNGTTSPTITFKTTAVVSAAGTASIPVTVDGVSITKQFAFAVALTGATGAKGATGSPGAAGKDGTDGKSIGSVINYYLATNNSSGVTTSTGGWTTTVQSVSATKKYLWNYEIVKYTDDTTIATTAPCIIGSYGETGATGATGATGNGIKSITEYYAVSTSNSTAPTSWSTSVPTLTTTNRYLWNYETITYTNGTTADTKKRVIGVYGNTGATGATGAKGDTGDTGSPGRSISSVTPQYYLSTSKTTATGGSWSDTYPTTIAKGKWLWTRLKIVYKNPTATEYTAGAYESLSDSRIEQFRDSIRLVVTDPSGNETSIKIDDEDHITLTGTVLAQVIDVAKLFAGDITATGKIQFDNGKYSLSIDETAKAVELSSWAALRLDGSPVEITSTGGYVSVSATNAVEVDGHTIRIEGRHYKNSSFRTGRDNAALTISGPLEAGEYAPALSMPTANGTWDIGTYNDDTLWVNYITTADYEAGNNDRTARMAFRADNKLYLPGGLQLADGTIADYVVDKGFSNIWNYQKFASGRTTIWARVTVSSAACSTAMGNWYRTADVVGQVAWPFALAGIPSVNVAFGGDDAGALAWLRGQSTKEVFSGAYCVRPTSATLSGYVYIQVMGWWK